MIWLHTVDIQGLIILTRSVSDFPRDPEQAESLLLEFGITHHVSISPAQPLSAAMSSVKHHHFSIPDCKKDALLLSLPDICKQISDAMDHGGLVLVHSHVESKAYIAVCAYCG
jgi:dual specificity phosphatase 12